MIITEQQSFNKSEFERTSLVEARCYQTPGPFLFCKNKTKGVVSELVFFLHNKNCLSCRRVPGEAWHTDCYLLSSLQYFAELLDGKLIIFSCLHIVPEFVFICLM